MGLLVPLAVVEAAVFLVVGDGVFATAVGPGVGVLSVLEDPSGIVWLGGAAAVVGDGVAVGVVAGVIAVGGSVPGTVASTSGVIRSSLEI